MSDFDLSCPQRCQGSRQALHGKNKLLNHEESLHSDRIFQSRNAVDTSGLSVFCKQNCEVRHPRASQDAVASIDAAGDVIPAAGQSELRGLIEKLTCERATILERLRDHSTPTPLESSDCRSYTDSVISHGH